MTDTYKNATLIIASHGSSKNPNQGLPARKQAQAIRDQGIFADVRTAFWKEGTFLKDALDGVETDEVVIVPNLACSGYINQSVIPREMGLDGVLTLRGKQRIQITRPVGEYEGLPELMANRLREIMTERNLAAKDTTIFLIAHGNPNPNRPASHDSTVMMATRIYQHLPVHAILPAFLEEKPFLEGWQKRTDSPNIIALPFMIAAGVHGAQDIPRYLGISPSEQQTHEMREYGTPAGPFQIGEQKVWMLRAMGSHPKIADAIVDLAKAQLKK